ncbi:MAG: hypothetical protein V4700_05750 [Pseudomonadota bacterium]
MLKEVDAAMSNNNGDLFTNLFSLTLEAHLGEKKNAEQLGKIQTSKEEVFPFQDIGEVGVVNARGDGNCGPRAIIQSLLLQGVLHNKKEFVIDFIKGIVTRVKEKTLNKYRENKGKYELDGFYKLDQPNYFPTFIGQYQKLTTEREIIDFFKLYLPKVITEENNPTAALPPDKEVEKRIDFLTRSNSMTTEEEAELNTLLEREAPSANNSPVNDEIIYFFSACLRQDASHFLDPIENIELVKKDPDLVGLNKDLDIGTIIPYLQGHKIALELCKANENKVEDSVGQEVSSFDKFVKDNYYIGEAELEINILWYHNHYSVLLFENEVKNYASKNAPDCSKDEEIARKLQIEEDEEIAKKFQIEEIKSFVEAMKDKTFVEQMKDKSFARQYEKNEVSQDFLQLQVLQILIEMIKGFFKKTTLESSVEELTKKIEKTGYSPAFFSAISNNNSIPENGNQKIESNFIRSGA